MKRPQETTERKAESVETRDPGKHTEMAKEEGRERARDRGQERKREGREGRQKESNGEREKSEAGMEREAEGMQQISGCSRGPDRPE